MAEFLIYNKTHDFEKLAVEKVTLLVDDSLRSYQARYVMGDIVRCYPDGYHDKHGFDSDAFCLVKVSGVKPDVVYYEPITEDAFRLEFDGKNNTAIRYTVILRRRRYCFDLTDVEIPKSKVVELKDLELLVEKKIG